jgi:hypothetical protein
MRRISSSPPTSASTRQCCRRGRACSASGKPFFLSITYIRSLLSLSLYIIYHFRSPSCSRTLPLQSLFCRRDRACSASGFFFADCIVFETLHADCILFETLHYIWHYTYITPHTAF